MAISRIFTLDMTSDLKKVLVDESSSAITYVGRALTANASTASAVWQIQRLRVNGTVTTRELADDGKYTQIWDNRASLFPDPALTNVYSLEFDGINDYVSFGDAHLYDVSNQFTMSFWVWLDNVASQRCVYSKVTADANVYGLSVQVTTGAKVFLQVRSAGGLASHTGSITVPTQTWTHICITHDGGSNMNGFRIYVDGTVDTTPSSTAFGASILSGQTAMLGARNGAFYHSGNIDEVTFWDLQFNSTEITELYNSGLPANPTTHSQSARLDSWYRMGDGDAYPTILDNAGTSDGTMTNMTSGDIVAEVP